MSGPAGAEVFRDERGRRVREVDRHGTLVAALTWAANGTLGTAGVRLPGGGWLTIAPRATIDLRWGASDVLRLGAAPLTHCTAVSWDRVDILPTLAEPARLPPGAGTAVLNLLAALAQDQRRPPLAYGGPYPTEQLFLSLLECFRWQPLFDDTPDPLAAFMAGDLLWAPAPHVRTFAPGGVCVQRRLGVEKIVWRGRSYHRIEAQGVARRAAHRVHDAGGRTLGSLWALGAPIESHVVLTADGHVLTAACPAPEPAPVRVAGPEVTAGLIAIVVAASAPPLAETLRAIASTLTFEWGPLSGELAIVAGERVRLSSRVGAALVARLAGADRTARLRLGLAALADLAHAVADPLRARAQARLAAAPEAVQAAALSVERSSGDGAAAARIIGGAVERLLEEADQLLA